MGSLLDRVYFRISVFCHFHWWLFSMYLVIFNEKSSWVILYFPEILCWNPNPVQYFYSCVAQWQCQGIFFCTIYFIYVPTWDHSSVFLCSYSSTKWVVEHKNRHLVETARTLLLHSHVPFRFWGDAVFTTCYLINHMPSSVLHNQIPHSLIFPDQPLYFLPPRVFCCTCFVHILTPGQDKLSARVTKCIFLGYSSFQTCFLVFWFWRTKNYPRKSCQTSLKVPGYRKGEGNSIFIIPHRKMSEAKEVQQCLYNSIPRAFMWPANKAIGILSIWVLTHKYSKWPCVIKHHSPKRTIITSLEGFYSLQISS